METTLLILKICAVIGLLDTAYLMWHKIRGTDVACIGFPKKWCQKVQYARQSRTIGVSNSIWGFLMYAAILLLVLFQANVPLWPVEALVAIGFVFAVYFTYVQAFQLRAFCTWCVISALNFSVMFWAVFVR